MAHLTTSLVATATLLALSAMLPTAISDPAHIAAIGEACSSGGALCPHYSGCVSGKCQCNEGYVSTVDRRNCLPETTQWQGDCTETLQCHLFEGAVCKDGDCQCEIGHHYLEKKCWITRHLNSQCQNSNECFLSPNQDRIECSDGVCKCKSQYHENELGDSCDGCSSMWSLGVMTLLIITSVQVLLN